MHAVIVYESMFGNTHDIADHIATGFRRAGQVTVRSVAETTPEALAEVDLLVVGGPTHVHGLTSTRSRAGAAEQAADDEELQMEANLDDPGLRDWLHDIADHPRRGAAAFDTRMDAPPGVTGRASKGIARRLRRRGFDLIVEPESFIVDKANHLLPPGSPDRAEQWGEALAAAVENVARR